MRGAEGYLEEYDNFDIDIVRKIAEYLEDAEFIEEPYTGPDEEDYSFDQALIEKTQAEDFSVSQQSHAERTGKYHKDSQI